jgi:hypothetical protein
MGGSIVLKGNHDSMFVEFLTQPPRPLVRQPIPAPQYRRARDAGLLWPVPETGSARALHDKAAGQTVPPKIIARSSTPCPSSTARGDCLFVHAGIQPGVPLEDQDPDRPDVDPRHVPLRHARSRGMLVVHGHTPVATVEHHGNRLAIDTGAGWDGPVSAVAIEGSHGMASDAIGPPARGEARLIGGRDLALVLLVVLAWGSNFAAMKTRVGGAAPAPLRRAALRHPPPAHRPVSRDPPRGLPILAIGTFINSGQFAFLFSAMEADVTAGLASLILQSQAPITIVLAAIFYGERVRLLQGLEASRSPVRGWRMFGVAGGGNVTPIGLVARADRARCRGPAATSCCGACRG